MLISATQDTTRRRNQNNTNRFSQALKSSLIIYLTTIALVDYRKLGAYCLWISEDHCYSDIGCFPLSDEFYHPRHRPWNVRPWHRRRINTQFELYSRRHVDGYQLRPWNRLNLRLSGFDPRLETKIIIPGWLDNIKRALWVRRMKDSLLWLWKPVNIIVVHWRNFTPYTIATANTRVVGAELANLLRFIEHELNYDRSYHHLIGHSLGAHIGGYCGDRLPGLGRITALDPARPFFQHMPKSVRLDRGDARFVDAIHSDFTPENAIFLLMSFGMTTPVGHLDFYPNGPPLLQPGCLRDTILSVRNGIRRGLQHQSLSIAFLESIRYLTACDHQRSHEWFIESITNRQCVFVGVRCNQYEGLINGRCTCDNSRSACAIMGIHADQMYLNDAHEDLWPLGMRKAARAGSGGRAHSRRKPPPPRPSMAPALYAGPAEFEQDPAHSQQLHRPLLMDEEAGSGQRPKGQLYSRLRFEAERLRHPERPKLAPEVLSGEQLDSENRLLMQSLSDMPSDRMFADYLRSSFYLSEEEKDSRGQMSRPLPRPATNHNPTRRQSSGNEDDDLGLTNELLGADSLASGHPKLLSDVDRDIENWYEDSSRWYLKTNHRPNYCVNQYQVLVFIGPLRATSGHHHIRANLIVSIIGSRGQLINQRFVPRSANLDSYTMQPFFILLEGSYSLGSILSVAVGWEARIDPDPVQATVSFQSNLLEVMQQSLPTYKAKHPWLSETMKYDHSADFRWQPTAHQHIERRSGDEASAAGSSRGSHNSTAISDDCSPTSGDRDSSCLAPLEQSIIDQLMAGSSDLLEDDEYDGAELEAQASGPEAEVAGGGGGDFNEEEEDELLVSLESGSSHHHHHQQENRMNIRRPPPPPIHLPEDSVHGLEAKLHNVGIHLDRDREDSIVISQVLVNPLQATYGRDGLKVGKLFCPPHQNYRLQKDKTVRLVPNLLLDRCSHHPSQSHY